MRSAFSEPYITRCVHDISQITVDEFFPDESSIFDVVWNAIFDVLSVNSLTEIHEFPSINRYPESIKTIGAIGSGSAIELPSLFIIGPVVSSAIELCRSATSPIELSDIRRTLKAETRRLNVPAHIEVALLTHVPELLYEIYGVQGDKVSDSTPSATANRKSVFCQRLMPNGREVETRSYFLNISRKMIGMQKYDIVVDETDHILSLPKYNKSEPIHKVRGMVRGMLWLVFTRLGKTLTHNEIRELFKIGHSAQENSIYAYTTALAKYLGSDLRSRIIESGDKGTYIVRKRGWSFIWIRQKESPLDSALLNFL